MKTRLARFALAVSHFAFAATVVLMPFRLNTILWAREIPSLYKEYTFYFIFASDAALVLTLVAWLISLALQPRRLHSGTNWIFAPLFGLTLISLLSAFFSVDPFFSFYQSVRLWLALGLYLFVVDQVGSLDLLLVPVAIQVLVQSVVGIAQFLQQHSLGLSMLGELVLDPTQSGISVVLADGTRTLRAYGLTDHPNILGGCLAFGLILLAGWYSKQSNRARTLPVLIVSLGGALTLLLTFSRSAWLALAGGMMLIVFLYWRTRQTSMLARQFTLLFVGLALLAPALWQDAGNLGVRFGLLETASGGNRLEFRSIDERQVLNNTANDLFFAHGLTGIGLGALPIAIKNAYPDFPYAIQPAHLVLLDVAAETGILGAMFYLVLLVVPWFALWVYRRRITFSPALITISAILLAVYLVGWFDYYTWLFSPGRLWQWLVWGLWAGSFRDSLIHQPVLSITP